MNKKTLLLAGLALGCSMAVAGVGIAVGASRTIETKADGDTVFYTLDGSVAGKDSGYATGEDITVNGIKWYVTGNATLNPWKLGGKKLSDVDRTVYSKGILETNVTKVELDIGSSNITVNSLNLIVSANSDFSNPISTISKTFAADSTITFTRPDATDWSDCYYKFVFNVTNSTNSNKGLEFKKARFYEEAAPAAKGFNITGVTSSGLYLNGDTYDIGYEAVGFDSAPTITDVVWTVPSGAGSIADGKWTAGPAAMENVTLGVDLKANGDDYHAEVTTKIDEVKHLIKNSPKAKFNAGEVFTVGGNFTVDYEYAADGSIPATDPEISYRLENVGGTKIKDLVYGETALTVEDSGSYVDVTYRGADLNERYSITVLDVFNNVAGAYYLVTDASQLADGDHVTFFGKYKAGTVSEKLLVPTSFGNNNVAAGLVTLDNGAIDGEQEFDILDFKLKDTGSDLAGSFAFEATNKAEKLGQYLYAAASVSNYLKTQESIDDNARFVVEIDGKTSIASVVASESSNRNVMNANGSSTLFSCYASSSSIHDDNDLYLYKWVSNTDKLNEFATSKLKMNEYVGDNTYSEERCTANYAAAKAAFNALTASQRSLFVAQSGEGKAYHDAYVRLTAWATVNGEELGGTDNVLAAKAASMSIFGSGNNDSTMLIALAVVGTGALATGGIMLAARKRRKEF